MQNETNGNSIPYKKFWVAIQQHLPIIKNSAKIGTIFTLFWIFIIHQLGLSLPKTSENSILFISLPLCLFAYVFFAGYAVNSVLSDFKEMSKARLIKDKDTFLIYRDERLPTLIHLLVGTVSAFIVLFTMLFPYDEILIGALSEFSVGFILTLVYLVVTALDKYYSKTWFEEKTPEEWLKEDVEEYFRKKQKPN